MKPVVHVENLSKIFKDFWLRPRANAVNGISFDVRPGEVFGLLGPNGSGKSTTIKILLGLLHVTRGTVTVLGEPPSHVASKARVGYLPEESYLYPYLDARESLHFYGALFGLPRSERTRRIEELLEMVGLQHTGRRRVGEFSKGMARRIGLAQALINDPDLVILDEPTSGLDPLGTRQVKDIIQALAKRGKTVLLSSHLLADVEDVCDRIAILYGGTIHAEGPIDELLKVTEKLQLTLPALDAEKTVAVREVLQELLNCAPEFSTPRMSLERFFLDVVARARTDGGPSSGAAGEGAVARFLSSVEKES